MNRLACAIFLLIFLACDQRFRAAPAQPDVNQLVKDFETETDSAKRLLLLREYPERETAGLLRALTQRGQELYDDGDYRHAIAVQETAITLAKDLRDPIGQANAARYLGATYAWQGKYREAIQQDTEALAILDPLPDSEEKKRVRMATLNNIGNVYNLQRQFSLAEDYYNQALELARELGDRAVIAKISNNLGDLDLSENKIDAAESNGNESLRIAEELKLNRTKAQALILLGLVAQDRSQFDQALARYKEAYDLYKADDIKEGMIRALHQQGEALLNNSKLDEAKAAFQQAATLAEEIDIPDLLWPCYCNEAEVAIGKHDDHAAEVFYEQAISTIEDIRLDLSGGAQGGAGFLTDKMVAYHGLIRLLIAKGDLAGALAQAERAKGRALLDALNSGTQLAQNLSKEESDQLEQLSAGLAALNKEVLNERQKNTPDETRLADLEVKRQHARNEIQAFMTNLGARAPQLEKQTALPFKMEDAQSILRNPESAAVEYVVTEDKLYAFILLSAKKPALVSIDIANSDLKKLVSEFRGDLTNPQHAIPKKSSQAVYERIFAPIRSHLEGIKNLIIIPDGPLWDLPFQALQSEHYLLDDFTISQTPSLAVLREMSRSLNQLKQAKSPICSLLVFANPAVSFETNATSQSPVLRGQKFAPLLEFHRQLRSGLSTASALRAAELKLRQNGEYAHPFYWASFVVAGAGE